MAQGATLFGCLEPQLSADEKAFFRDANPWGFILFARNIVSKDQVARLCDALRDTVGWHAPILIDQEGGRVQRLRAPDWLEFLPPLDQCNTLDPDDQVTAMYLRSRLIAEELSEIGIDVNCAPMADIAQSNTHEFLHNRCYGSTVDQIVANSKAVIAGQADGGVMSVLKHIPGHGRATLDSHLELPVVDTDADTLRSQDFEVFRQLNDIPLGMTAHIVYSAFDPDQPATSSKPMMDIIRNEIGFDGFLMTDDINMEALEGTLTQRCTSSIAAGCDVVLHCNGKLPEMIEVAAASGTLTDAAQTRADRAIATRPDATAIDKTALQVELNALVAGAVS